MPSMDIARRRLRLSDSHISVLGLLAEEGRLPQELATAKRELVTAGIIDGEDKIVAELYPLVSTLMVPRVIAQVELSGPRGTTRSGAVVGDDFLFTHENWPGDTESEYVPAEPGTLVWGLARMVGLHRDLTAETDSAEEITTTMGAFDRVVERMEASALDEPQAMAGDAGAPPRLVEVLAQLNCMWRMTVVWHGSARLPADGNPAVSGLAVWDCGLEGYWLRELPAEPVADGRVNSESVLRVRRTSAEQLWRMITDLLPSGDELRAAKT
ncbi:hypothetical protein GA0115242_109414 [Streptomyces sp. SolWspMP-5a-2]|nr:hypothetical protein [Streptomyces sp. SID4950]SCD58433.1 hypothetical protein GA0115242_109414 [Streptomyces sp. SolWspMP-5a-2]